MRFCQIQSQEALGGAPDGVTLNSEGHDFLVKFSPPPPRVLLLFVCFHF